MVWRMPEDFYYELIEHELSFSDFCSKYMDEQRLEWDGVKRKKRSDTYKSMMDSVYLFFFGVILFGLTYVVINYIVFILLNIGGGICMAVGLIRLFLQMKHAVTYRRNSR